jgi:hypothetical protein
MKNSKWSYIFVGMNIMIAILGAAVHNLILIAMGFIFTFLNWRNAENLRRIEDEKIRESVAPETDK